MRSVSYTHLQAAEVRLIPHVVDFPQLAGLDALRHLVQDGLGGGGCLLYTSTGPGTFMNSQ